MNYLKLIPATVLSLASAEVQFIDTGSHLKRDHVMAPRTEASMVYGPPTYDLSDQYVRSNAEIFGV